MLTTVPKPTSRQESALTWCALAAVAVVLLFSALDWAGWATDNDRLTRVFASWPHMPPWSALLQCLLGVAVLLQLGRPPPARVRAGRSLAVAAGVVAAVFCAEHATGRSLGLDQVLFSDALESVPGTWSGRPSAWTAVSAVLLSSGITLLRLDRKWVHRVWPACLAAAVVLPTITVLTYVFEAALLMDATRDSGQAIGSVLSLVLLTAATAMARPDRAPLAWLLARPDRWTLVRMIGIVAGLPVLVGVSRVAVLNTGRHGDAAWVLSIILATVVVAFAVLFASQREQRLLIEKEALSTARAQAESERADAERERAEAEQRFRLLADNAVDVVVHHRGVEVVWVSPSVEAAFGWPPENWIGSDFTDRIHPDDLSAAAVAMAKIADGGTAFARCRIATAEGGYHWVDVHGKPYFDAKGNADGVIAAVRIVDDQVEAERKLERLARFDALTGLVSRSEAIARFESALACSRTAGTELGVLFCDVDRFKTINDTYGHSVGDAVLWAVAERISECVRHGDTVGRTGGDEMLVLLPGLHSLQEAVQIAEKIQSRNAEPIHHSGRTFHATLSVGATLAAPGESVTEVTARADEAMYQAKHAGGNSVAYI